MNHLFTRIGRSFLALYPPPGSAMVVVYIVSAGHSKPYWPHPLTSLGKQQAREAAAVITKHADILKTGVLAPNASTDVVAWAVNDTVDLFRQAGMHGFLLYSLALSELFEHPESASTSWISQLTRYRMALNLGTTARMNLVLVDHPTGLEEFLPCKCPPGSVYELTMLIKTQTGRITWRRFHKLLPR
jgi:hypothetical protein